MLCNNAGVMNKDDVATEDGVDLQMGVNHLAPFLLTKYAMPCLEKAAALRGEARVVQQSSCLRALPSAEKNWDNTLQQRYLEKNGGNLGGSVSSLAASGPNWQRYQQSKLGESLAEYRLTTANPCPFRTMLVTRHTRHPRHSPLATRHSRATCHSPLTM